MPQSIAKPRPSTRAGEAGVSAAQQTTFWQAVVRRDASFEGRFIVAVRSTGIYCRPGCPARTPKRENVHFFADANAAAAAGYRECKRCRPRSASPAAAGAARIAAACRLIESAESPPDLASLAEAAGLSPHHFHRLFKAATGVTPKAYAAAHRRELVQTGLPSAPSVTAALYDAGFNSSARFYAKAKTELGMSPKQARAKGKGLTLQFATAPCSLGLVLVAQSPKGIAAILLGDDREVLEAELRERFGNAQHLATDDGLEDTLTKVVALIDQPARGLDLPLDIRGTAFQQQVWTALRAIPPGTTATYTEVAARIGKPSAVRAVAAACAANPVAVVVPCHRVIRRGGQLAGYRWGLERKRRLLASEQGED